MDVPFGVPGKTRRGSESSCLLTLLTDTTAERIRYCYSHNDHDVDDIRQEIILHVLSNWKHYKPHIPIGAALRVMVGQGASRAVARLRQKGDLVLINASDISGKESNGDFLSWVPEVAANYSWNPDDGADVDVPPSAVKNEQSVGNVPDRQLTLF